MAEAAAARGQSSAATLVDLVKAFEMVKLELVWARGIELGFPALILRMVLETFAFTRRLYLRGAVADAVDTLSAILAGGGFATDALLIVLIKRAFCACVCWKAVGQLSQEAWTKQWLFTNGIEKIEQFYIFSHEDHSSPRSSPNARRAGI